jgi:hypothetical protein
MISGADHLVQLVSSLHETLRVISVDDKYNALGVVIIISPEGTYTTLTAHIPNGERDVLVLNGLDVEP